MMNEKKMALLQLEQVEVNDDNLQEIEISSYNNNVFEYQSAEYLICTDDQADEEFYDSQISLIEDMGIECFTESFQNEIINNYADLQPLEGAMRESFESYVEDIEYEEGRLEEEMSDAGVETKEDYVEYLCEQEDASEWYKNNFGDEDYEKFVTKNCNIEWDEVIEKTERLDGRGLTLARYDGNENKETVNDTTYYIYRIN